MRILKHYEDGAVDIVAKVSLDDLRKQADWLYRMNPGDADEAYEGLLNLVEHLLEAGDERPDVHGKAVELAFSGNDALLFLPTSVPGRQEFVIARGYDRETKSWSSGTYFSSLVDAAVEFDSQKAAEALDTSTVVDPYEAYKLRWMLAHDKTLADYVSGLDEVAEEASFCGENLTAEQAAAEFEADRGFDGEIWACREEWEEEGR